MQRKNYSFHNFFAIVFTLLFVSAFVFTGCHYPQASDPTQPTPTLDPQSTTAPSEDVPPVEKLQITLHGALVDANGQVQESAEIPVTGTTWTEPDGSDAYLFSFDYPQDHHFQVSFNPPVRVPGDAQTSYRRALGLGQKKDDDKTILCQLGIDLDNQCVIVDWDDGADVYLIASTDPNPNIAELWQYFQGFFEMCPDEWPQVSVG